MYIHNNDNIYKYNFVLKNLFFFFKSHCFSSSNTSNKINLCIGRFKVVDPVLRVTTLTKPSGPLCTPIIFANGQEEGGMVSSEINTTSLTSRFFLSSCHLWRSCRVCKYSVDHDRHQSCNFCWMSLYLSERGVFSSR